MHHKLTKHERFCKQNNQLPTKTHVELKANSNMQALKVNKVKQLFLSRVLSSCYLVYFQVSLQARQLMRSLLQRNPSRRLGSHRGANDIKTHDFFKGIDWALLRNMVKLHKKRFT